MSAQYKGACQCGDVRVELSLSGSLSGYSARACDCDFCRARNIAWLSDPQGRLRIRADRPLAALSQGSRQARFMVCRDCEQVICVAHQFESGWKGAVNAALLDEREQLSPAQTVSPKRLGPDDKKARWDQVWCPLDIEELES